MVAALVGLTLIVLLVHDIPLANYLRTVEQSRLTTTLERDSFILAGNSQRALTIPNPFNELQLRAAINKYDKNSDAVVIVTDSIGKVFVSTDPDIKKGESFQSRPEIAQALKGSVTQGQRFSQTLNYEIFYVAVPILSGTKILGTVRITFPTRTVDAMVESRLKIIQLIAFISLAVALMLALILAFSITHRLSSLQEVTERFSDGDFDSRANDQAGAPEIKSLASSFNKMAEQQSRFLQEQSAFAADASHQLRTPLTALQLRLERVTELIESDPTGATERLEAARLETDRLQNIVEGLLVLSRASKQHEHELLTYDLTAVAKERIESWNAFANESHITIKLIAPESAKVVAVSGAVEQVIDNYIDNALAIAPSQSEIIVNIEIDADITKLHVMDLGPGLPEEDLERAFNRFWRARSDAHGSGLGLAIVERLVTASGGRVYLSNRVPHGLDACAQFKTA